MPLVWSKWCPFNKIEIEIEEERYFNVFLNIKIFTWKTWIWEIYIAFFV